MHTSSNSLGIGWVALTLVAFTAPLLGASDEEKPLTPDERAVLAPLQNVLDGIAKGDKAAVRNQLLPGGSATLIRNGQILQLHFDSFVERISTSTQKLEERIHDPLIRIDDDIAIIWAPYEFLIEGKIDHRGTDVVNLVRHDGRWMIAGIADNSRKVQDNH